MSFLKKKALELRTSILPTIFWTVLYVSHFIEMEIWILAIVISVLLSITETLQTKIPYMKKRKKELEKKERTIAELKKELRTIPFYQEYQGKLLKLFWGRTIQTKQFLYSNLFYIKQKDSQHFWEDAVPEYKWLYYESFWVSLDDIERLRAFQMELQHAYNLFMKQNNLRWHYRVFGKHYPNVPQMKRLIQELDDSRTKLKQILNPVSRKFNDNRSPSEILNEQNHSLVIHQNVNQKELSEGLRQLYEVLEDNHLSETTREEVLRTIERIQNQEAETQEKAKLETSETNARAVIEASKSYYHLSD